MPRNLVAGLLVAAIAASSGCDENANISGLPGYAVGEVRVSPRVDTLFIPDTVRSTDRVQFTATVIGKDLLERTVPMVWSVSDPSIATIDFQGLVTPRGLGTVEIKAEADKEGTATLVILPMPLPSLAVTPATDTIFVEEPIVPARDTARFTAQALDTLGQPIAGVLYAWGIAPSNVATVDQTGLVRAAELGTATVSVAALDQVEQRTLHVLPVIASIELAAHPSAVLALDTVQLVASARDYAGAVVQRTFNWTSSNSSVATVDAMGNVLFVGTGQATITARSAFRTVATTITAHPRQLVAFDAGTDFNCGFTPLGRGYCWGLETTGQTASASDSTCFGAIGNPQGCTLPPKRMQEADIEFTSMSAGGAFACGVDANQMLWCWGSDSDGQRGNGLSGGGAVPALATVKNERFTMVSAGDRHACALNLAGTAYCWGADDAGQLGDTKLVNSTTPIPVADTTLSFTRISAGGQHTCGIVTSGLAYCWGDGSQGQLGSGGAASSQVPVAVSGGRTYSEIAAGFNHTCAVETTGNVYCWGNNSTGQLGIGNTTSQLGPTLTLAGGGFTAITAGGDSTALGTRSHTCGVANGNAICWGDSNWGQVGSGVINGIVTNPTQVSGPFQASAISAGESHTCAIASGTGLTWCWGSNRYGALGNEYQAAARATPQLVARPR
jgi:alpha-tubulin suppressor-like RCC1 family protein